MVTLKHWDAYSLEDSDGYTRHDFDAVVTPYDLQATYTPAFKASVQAGAKGIMCSCACLWCGAVWLPLLSPVAACDHCTWQTMR